MKPFNDYPQRGRTLLGRFSCNGNCRKQYGLRLQRLTGQTQCAYCGQSLVDTYAHWLLLSVDHVVPRAAGVKVGIDGRYLNDYINCVLCCSGCNGFQWPADGLTVPCSDEGFVALRGDVFRRKSDWLIGRREEEQDFFSSHPWSRRRVSQILRDPV